MTEQAPDMSVYDQALQRKRYPIGSIVGCSGLHENLVLFKILSHESSSGVCFQVEVVGVHPRIEEILRQRVCDASRPTYWEGELEANAVGTVHNILSSMIQEAEAMFALALISQ